MSGILGNEPFGKSGIIGKFLSKGISDRGTSESLKVEASGIVYTTSPRITLGTMGMQVYEAYWQNNVAYTVSFPVRSISGGAVWQIMAAHSHYQHLYGCATTTYKVFYNGSNSGAMTPYNYTTGLGGSFTTNSSSGPNITVTKEAGSYSGWGQGIIIVIGPV